MNATKVKRMLRDDPRCRADVIGDLAHAVASQHPIYPATFGPCACGRDRARGSRECSLCATETLAHAVGPELANLWKFVCVERARVYSLLVNSEESA